MANRNQKHAQIITLAENTGKRTREIAEAVGVNQSTVSRVIKQFRETGDFQTRYQNCGGHNKVFNERDIRHIRSLCVQSPKSTANELRLQLGAAGDGVSVSTMKQALQEAGCHTKKPIKRLLLTESHKQKRLEWARQHREWTIEDWKKVLWSDETMICVGGQKSKFVRVVDGHELTDAHFDLTTKFPTIVMFWGCFSWHGTGRALAVEENVNVEYYIPQIINR